MTDLLVERLDVWAASIHDEPGGLARVLTGLREAGADLDFILARRSADKSGTGVVFLTPLRGDAEVGAGATLGFKSTSSVHSVRVEGKNEPGIAAALTAKLAAEGINLRGFSAAVIGARFVVYIGLDSAAEAERAITILRQM
jgi:hypothetical protein